MFAPPRPIVVGFVLVALLALALFAARPSDGAVDAPAAEERYVVQPGDTLWAVAAARYEGDPRRAVWRIRERNGLAGATLVPGQTLVLPS